MESAMSPREIQARVRAGASLDDVAAQAGMPRDRVEAFAAPVLAERAHVAGTALMSPIRRSGEAGPHPTLRHFTEPQFAERGVSFSDVTWDAWRGEDRRWTVRASWLEEGDDRHADFLFDQASRFSIAADQSAKDLVQERQPEPAPQLDPDNEPTIDLDDEFALVRATQSSPSDVRIEFTEVEIEQIDGVYDFVPGTGELDVLYDVLSTISEDSGPIYEQFDAPEADSVHPMMESELPATPEPPTTPEPQPTPEPQAEPAEPEQEPLVELSKPIPTKRPRKRHAAVPSWDEILFGTRGSQD